MGTDLRFDPKLRRGTADHPAEPSEAPKPNVASQEQSAPVPSGWSGPLPKKSAVRGDDNNQAFGFQVGGKKDAVKPSQSPLVKALPAVRATNIQELLAELPVQTQIVDILRAQAKPKIALPDLEAMKAALPASYARVLSDLPELTRFFNPVELYTADDIAAVKTKFLEKAAEGVLENPELRYEQGLAALRKTLDARGLTVEGIEQRVRSMRAEVAADRPPPGDELTAIMQKAILRKLDDDLATIDLFHGLERRDDRLVKKAFTAKYGRGVDDKLYGAAKKVMAYLVKTQAHAGQNKKEQIGAGELDPAVAKHAARAEQMTAGEFKGAVDWMLSRYYSTYEQKTGRPFPESLKFKVEVNPAYSAVDVRDKSSEGPVIGIPDKPRSYKKYLELLRHEIDMHVRQSLNGALMFGFGGGALKIDEETWYEGLAKHNEIELMRTMFGDESEPTLPYYTFGIRMAEEGKSFVEVFEAARALRLAAGSSEKLADANAWNTAYRVFRGHTDLENKEAFAMPKDQAYLRGWMLQAQLSERGLSHLNESAICPLEGLELLARFDYGPKDLLFPDVNLTGAYWDGVLRPRIDAEMAAEAEALAKAEAEQAQAALKAE